MLGHYAGNPFHLLVTLGSVVMSHHLLLNSVAHFERGGNIFFFYKGRVIVKKCLLLIPE